MSFNWSTVNMPKKTFNGVLAVGRSHSEAANQYRLLAMGKGATVQVSGEGQVFVTQASSAENMFNPHNGDMDLVVESSMLDQLEFSATASDRVTAPHYVCESGCGAHVIADSDQVKYCPNCTSAVVAASDDVSDSDAGGEAASDSDTGAAASGSDEASDAGSDAGSGSDGDDDLAVVASSYDEALEIYTTNKIGVSQSGNAEVHYVVCSSAACSAHILSDKEVSECPSCQSAVQEPTMSVSSDAASDAASDVDSAEDSDAGSGSDAEVTAAGSDSTSDSDAGSNSDATSDSDASSDTEATAAGSDVASDAGSDAASDAASDAGSEEDDGELAVVASSRAEAERMFAEQFIGVVTASSMDAQYVVCSSDDCGAHIIGTKHLDDCPVCHSSTEEPSGSDTEGSDGEVSSDADDSDTDSSLGVTDDEGNSLTEKTSDLDVSNEVPESAEAADLDVSYSSMIAGGSRWTAFYKGLPVAMASRTDAGKNADVFDQPTFGHAVLASAKVAGVKKALIEMGFKGIKYPVSISAEVQRMVEERTASVSADLDKEQAEFKSNFIAALSTAAIGLNRGFFTDVQSPLKAGLWTALSTAGMQQPEVVLDSIFRSHSDAYHKVLIDKAEEILTQPAQVQESLAKAILGANYQSVSSDASGSLEDRLGNIGTSVSSAVQAAPEAQPSRVVEPQSGMDLIHAAVSSLGRRRRN
jgi:rubrerythrin